MGRPRSTWDPRKDVFVTHAEAANVTEDVLVAVRNGAFGYRNPWVRLSVVDALLHLGEELHQARKDAVVELRQQQGRTYSEIGALMGVSRQRAWQIGNDR